MKDRSRPSSAPGELQPTAKASLPAVETYRQARDKTLEYVRETRDPLRQRYGKFGPNVLEVYQILWGIPAHAERHLAQIEEVKANPNFPKR
jgi:hypothetical protein